MWPVSNWLGVVMVMAVLFEAQGGEARFPAGPRALLRWFESGRNRLSRIKKVSPVSNWHGGVMVKAVLFEAQGGEARSRLGRELFYVGLRVEETD